MNYLKVYCNLIRKSENRTPPEGYTEKHHTFPKSIYGNNNRIVILTAREHYIAHALIEKICIQRYGLKHWKTIKMNFAHLSMKGNANYYNSYLYENAKIRFSNIFKGRKIPEKTKIKMGLYNKGKESRRYGKKHTEELKNKWRQERGREFCVLSPNGEIVCDKNITNFCRINGLHKSSFSEVINGKRKQHKGWRNVKDYEKSDYDLKIGREFVIIDENNNIIIEKNIKDFCRKNKLNRASFRGILNDKSKSYKGYRSL